MIVLCLCSIILKKIKKNKKNKKGSRVHTVIPLADRVPEPAIQKMHDTAKRLSQLIHIV